LEFRLGWELFGCLVHYVFCLKKANDDFMSCKEFEGQGLYIHFCDNTNLIRHRKDTFVSICQSHQSLSTVLTVKVLGMCCVGTRFARDSEEAISESLGFLPADFDPLIMF